jgi:hypothetical protein
VIAGWPALIGIMRYSGEDGPAISGTIWCGRVGYDTVTIAYRCGQEHEGEMPALMTAILGTVSFTAQKAAQGSAAASSQANPRPHPSTAVSETYAYATGLIVFPEPFAAIPPLIWGDFLRRGVGTLRHVE